MNKKFFIKLFTVLVILFSFALPVLSQEEAAPPDAKVDYASGKVLEILSQQNNKDLEDSFHTKQVTQTVKVLVLSGKYRGRTVNIENQLTSNPIYDINIKKGNRVVLEIDEIPNGVEFNIADLERVPVLLILAGSFLALLLIIGGMQGLRSIISIVATGMLVFLVLVPAVLNNVPVIPATIAVAFLATFITMFTVAGINKKSLSAALGTIISVLISGVVSSLVIKYAPLNGFNTQESAILWAGRPDIDFTGLLTAGVIIASLGAVMDVGMSIASSIYELKSVNPTLKIKDLFRSGLNVGKDIMGTMSNTLILAYLGGGFSLVLLASNSPLVKLINLNSISAEITSAIAGSIGIIFCVPITAVIAAYLIGKENNKADTNIAVSKDDDLEANLAK
jgi:uncharacterized membrane protein